MHTLESTTLFLYWLLMFSLLFKKKSESYQFDHRVKTILLSPWNPTQICSEQTTIFITISCSSLVSFLRDSYFSKGSPCLGQPRLASAKHSKAMSLHIPMRCTRLRNSVRPAVQSSFYGQIVEPRTVIRLHVHLRVPMMAAYARA